LKVMNVLGITGTHQKFRYYDRQTPQRSRGSIISNYTFFY